MFSKGSYTLVHHGVAALLSWPEELSRSLARLDAVLVIDAWHETHKSLARRYIELGGVYLSRPDLREPAVQRVLAAQLCEAECGDGYEWSGGTTTRR